MIAIKQTHEPRALLDSSCAAQYTPSMTADTTYIDELSGVYNRKYLEEEQKEAAVKFIAHQISCKEHAQKALDIFKFIKTKSWKEKAEAIIKECASV